MDVDGEKQAQDGLAEEVNDSLGMDESAAKGETPEAHEASEMEGKHSNATLAVQKRLKSQKRAHEREVRELHARIGDLESRMTQPNYTSHTQEPPYTPQGGVDETIHKAVSYALQHKENEERKARDVQQQAHVARQYQEMQKHLDNMGEKYEDFHDVVLNDEAPFTSAMRDYALTLPRKGAGSAGEVLYKLAKNPEELSRIAKLHPLDQASEMAKLSHALIGGGEDKAPQTTRTMGQIKSNPVTNSHIVTDKTPVSSIRQRMKQGTWK